MKGIFVTGTDTGVGKTVVTGLLARYLLDKGHNVITQKWVETGCRGSLSGSLVAPYRFKIPCSPHLASRIEKRRINPVKIVESFKLLSKDFDFIIVEGIGGALVPFNKKYLVIDIAVKLKLPVLVVAQNKLGAINHTLLTIEALRRKKLEILGVIFNNIKKEDKRISEDNPLIIKALTGERVFGILPCVRDCNNLYKRFMPLGDKIYKKLCI